MSEPIPKRQLAFELKWLNDPDGKLDAEVAIVADGQSINQAFDPVIEVEHRGSPMSALDFAHWLLENWWRLCHEPASGSRRRTLEWRLSHQLRGAGGGSAWPPLTIESDGATTSLRVDRSTDQMSPYVFLRPNTVAVETSVWAAAVNEFVDAVLQRGAKRLHPTDFEELQAAWTQLLSEQQTPALRKLRRYEAILGQAPETYDINELERLLYPIAWVGDAAIDEALAVVRPDALQSGIAELAKLGQRPGTALDCAGLAHCTPGAEWDRARTAWEMGEALGLRVRRALGLNDEPLPNQRLDEATNGTFGAVVDAESADFGHLATLTGSATRCGDASTCNYTALVRGHIPSGRRFKTACLVGDILMHGATDGWAPASGAVTHRQRANRSFAQTLLLPESALRNAVHNHDGELEDLVQQVASDYAVSEVMVQATLMNKHLVDRSDVQALGVLG